MPREYRPGAYDRSKNSYNYTNSTSGASGGNNHNRSGGNFPNYSGNNRNSTNSSSNNNNSNNTSTKRNNNGTRINSGISHPSQSNNSQPSTSKNSSGITSCYRKFFVNKRSTAATKQDEVPTTSTAFWKPKSTATSLAQRATSSLAKTSNYFNKLLEIQRKFPLWKPEYKTNVFRVRNILKESHF